MKFIGCCCLSLGSAPCLLCTPLLPPLLRKERRGEGRDWRLSELMQQRSCESNSVLTSQQVHARKERQRLQRATAAGDNRSSSAATAADG